MAATAAILVAIGAVLAAEVLIVFLDGIVDVHDANAGFTGAFLLCHCRHDRFLSICVFMGVCKQVLNHDVENRMHTGVCQRIKHLLAAPLRFEHASRPQEP